MTLLKGIVLGLALANIAYFLWTDGIAPTQAVPVDAPTTTLTLVSEAPAPGAAGAAENASESSGLTANLSRCVTVGPFRDVSEASHAASTLRAGGYDPRQRVVEGDVWAGVWVYLPLPITHPAADQMLAQLKGAGIEDAMEMPGPADGSVISLGLFSEQKRAQARVVQAQSLGFSPTMADRKRNGNQYWIDVDLKPTDGSINPADLQGEAGRIQRLDMKPCPPVAQS